MRLVLYFIVLFNSFAFGAINYFKLEQKITREERKDIKKCIKFYEEAELNFNQVNKYNAMDSFKCFECIAESLQLKKYRNPKNIKEAEINKIINSKVAYYSEIAMKINAKFDLNFTPTNFYELNEEVTVEKNIVFKGTKTQEIQDLRKITPKTLKEAKAECKNKGFKETSFDKLEGHLFKKCLEELGFEAPSNNIKFYNYSHSQALKVKRQEEQVVKKRNKIAKQAQKDENKRKLQLQKQQKQEAPKNNVFVENKQPVVQNKIIESTYLKKTTCKIDINGNKICQYDTSIKK